MNIGGEEKMSDFNIGDKIEYASDEEMYSITRKENGYGIITEIHKDSYKDITIEWYYKNGRKHSTTFNVVSKYFKKINEQIIKTQGEIKMELKDVKQTNLVEAKKQFDLAKANEEVEFAKQQLRVATDKINEYDRQIKQLEEMKKPYLETLAKFK